MSNIRLIDNLPALREAKRSNDSHFNRIWKFYYDQGKAIALTDFEDELRRRFDNIWKLITGKVLNDSKAVKAHTIWCKENCMQISERTAWDDLRRAKMLYGDPRMSTAAWEKKRMSEILIDQIELMRSIQETGDTQEKIEAAKNINLLTRRYNAINGLENDLKTQVPRAPITIVFNADPETLRKQAEELMNDVTKDVDYTLES